MRYQRFAALLLAAACCLTAVTGCAGGGGSDDADTLTIMYSRHTPEAFFRGLEEAYPEINFEYEFYHGANHTEYINQGLKHGEAADIVIHTTSLNEREAEEYLLDLSGYSFLGNFDNAILNTMARDGRVYQLPGPVSCRCIFYNKTLFDMYGWEEPTTYNELLALVKQIRSDAPDMTPIAMSTVAPGYPFTIVSSLAQCGFLSTPAGVDWEERYFNGEASVGEGFAEGLTMMEQLIDANAFDGEKYTDIWNVIGGDPCERKAAMSVCFNGTQGVLPLLDKTADPEIYGQYCSDDFGLLPFFGLEDGQEGLSIVLTSTWGINKCLGEKGNEKKLENALKVMEFIASTEGQLLLQTDNGQIPTLKTLENTDVHPEVQKLWELNESGRKTPYLYSGYEDIMIEGGYIVRDALLADDAAGMREKFIETCDAIHQKALQGETASQSYGTFEETLTIEESGRLVMAAVQQKHPADFMLATWRDIDQGVINASGIGGRFFEGVLTEAYMNIVLPGYNSSIQTIELTGAEVKAMLENGKTIVSGEQEGHFSYTVWGLDVEKKDGKITSVKANGTELSDDAVYTVNFLEGDYDASYEESGRVVNTELLIFDAIAEYVQAHGPITADMLDQ